MNSQVNELKRIVEAAILVSDDPISINRITSLFPDGAKPEKAEVMAAIEELSADCEQRGIELKKVGNGYRFQSKERYAEFLRKLYELKPPRYSRAVLETLSIIAYRQPVTRGDIEDVRGVSVSTEIMRTLLNRQWVKEVGFKDVPGRPALFATTKEFLAYFNLKTIREMPELQQKRELEEIAKDNQITMPFDDPELNQNEESDTTKAKDSQVIDAELVEIKSSELDVNEDLSAADTIATQKHAEVDADAETQPGDTQVLEKASA